MTCLSLMGETHPSTGSPCTELPPPPSPVCELLVFYIHSDRANMGGKVRNMVGVQDMVAGNQWKLHNILNYFPEYCNVDYTKLDL